MSRSKILVTQTEYAKGRDTFNAACCEAVEFVCAPDDELPLAEAVRKSGAVGVILGIQRYSDQLYDALPAGGFVARFGVGHDGVDKTRCKARDIFITNTPGVLDVSVAENAVSLMCALARSAPAHTAAVKAGKWDAFRGVELRGKTLSVIGFGRVGREVASIAANGFKMNIVACDIAGTAEQTAFAECLGSGAGVSTRFTASIDDALASGRFVSLHVPLLPQTRNLIDSQKLALLADDAYLINTSRGGVVDENALYDALATGKLAGAATDVFATEPYVPVSPEKDLRTLSNVVLTPHISSNTDASNRRMAEACVANAMAYVSGNYAEMSTVQS